MGWGEEAESKGEARRDFTSVHFDNDNQAMQLSIESFEMTEETDTV